MRIFFSAMIAVIGLHLIDNSPLGGGPQLYAGIALALIGSGLVVIFAFVDWAGPADD